MEIEKIASCNCCFDDQKCSKSCFVSFWLAIDRWKTEVCNWLIGLLGDHTLSVELKHQHGAW